MKKIFYLTVICLIITSCSFNGGFQGLYSYYNKTKKESPNLFIKTKNTDTICGKYSKIENFIFITDGLTLKKCLLKNEKSIVYIWGSKCKSKVCYPLEIIQSYCLKNGYSLFILAEYYDSEGMNFDYNLEKNIIAVDTKYYKTNLTTKYLNGFLKDIDNKLEYNKLENKYLYFEKNNFINDFNSIYEINSNN
ncbi:MAG: opacity protein-like surface antigen [Polaribacter sp.]|jgi:opacity protein-like surface antigen